MLALAAAAAGGRALATSEGEKPATPTPWPARVLLTNDDGIDSDSLVALARAFAPLAETYVVAPDRDWSASSTVTTVFVGDRSLTASPRDLGEGITAWAVQGSPADCVLLGLRGILAERPPDLIISGVNGGPNLDQAWVLSGTIGAVRMAASLGVPGIAVSGLARDDDRAMAAVTGWVVRLASSPPARSLKEGDYLTVSLPPLPPERITGLEVVRRASWQAHLSLRPEEGEPQEGGTRTWRLQARRLEQPPPAGTDAAALAAGRIAVVPMHLDEHDEARLASAPAWQGGLPAWTAPPPRP